MNREEIIAKVENITGIDVDEVTDICEDWIDWVQDDICRRHDFSFLIDYGQINTTPSYSTGTVEITQDSTTVTGTGTVWTSDMVGRLIKFSGSDEYYEISAVGGNTSLTLSSAYIGTTDTDATYEIYRVYYPLASDFKKMKWVKQIITPARLKPLPELTFAEYVPDEFDYSGELVGYILSGVDSSGYTLIRPYPIQTTRKRIYYCYKKQLPTINTTGATSAIPSDWHMLFVYKLAQFVYHRNDNMGQKETQMYQMYEEDLKKFIAEDSQKTDDISYQMQDEITSRSIPMAHLPYNHFERP